MGARSRRASSIVMEQQSMCRIYSNQMCLPLFLQRHLQYQEQVYPKTDTFQPAAFVSVILVVFHNIVDLYTTSVSRDLGFLRLFPLFHASLRKLCQKSLMFLQQSHKTPPWIEVSLLINSFNQC